MRHAVLISADGSCSVACGSSSRSFDLDAAVRCGHEIIDSRNVGGGLLLILSDTPGRREPRVRRVDEACVSGV